MNPFFVVEEFERQVAEFAGARYAVAVNTGTSALFLSLSYRRAHTKHVSPTAAVVLPAHTFISVPMMCMHAGYRVIFEDKPWKGVYDLRPYNIIDGALRFRRGMYEGGLHCLSFHSRKLLPIGEGGMVLTDDVEARDWLRKARYCGRSAPDYSVEDVSMLGWLMYMSVDKAARGLQLMQWVGDGYPDQEVAYNDLRKVKAFEKSVHTRFQTESTLA